MKEFKYYQNLLTRFTKLFKEYKKMQQIWSNRNKLGLEDDALAWHLDFLMEEAGSICSYNAISDFLDIYMAFDDHKYIVFYNSKNELVKWECKNVEELFDVCYAMNLKNNLTYTIKQYLSFEPETAETILFLCWDNDFIDLMYSEKQLTEMAKEITDELDKKYLMCWYDGEKFELIEK